MRASKIFIASSHQAKGCAGALAHLLRQNMSEEEIKVETWWTNSFPPSGAILSSLIEICNGFDFAAVFLTRDEAENVKDEAAEKKKSILLAPRDNCIFESGLFMGAWGATRRCFLLTSTSFKEIFSDVHGLAVLPIVEAEDHPSLQSAAAEIRKAVKLLGPIRKPEMVCYSEAEVLERERVETNFLMQGSQVLINLKRPIEVDRQFSDKIMKNLKDEVKYSYFFSAGEDLEFIAQLVRSVATAGSEEVESETFNKNLAFMKKRFRISLLPQGKPPEFCIHNALRDQATCYLRVPGRADERKFVEWCRGNEANEFVKDIQGDQSLPPDSRIFRSTREFDLYTNKKVLTALKEFIRSEFDAPPIQERVLTLCFGESPAPAPPSRTARPRRAKPVHAARRTTQ